MIKYLLESVDYLPLILMVCLHIQHGSDNDAQNGMSVIVIRIKIGLNSWDPNKIYKNHDFRLRIPKIL